MRGGYAHAPLEILELLESTLDAKHIEPWTAAR
jgi:hypothetical protein